MRILVLVIIILGFDVFIPQSFETQVLAANNQEDSKQLIISKRKAIKAAQREVKGKVLSANLIKSRGPAVYRIKMLVGEKRVRTVFVDGKNARVIRIN